MKFTATNFLTALLLGLHRSCAQDDCTPCDDKPTPAMENKGKKCEDFPNAILSKCQDADNWIDNGFCQKTCFENGRGYEGDDCCVDGPSNAAETEALENSNDDCSPNPCESGGTCQDDINAYTCTCPAGYAGTDCEINIDDCSPNPCESGGTCQDDINAYTCTCPAGYAGTDCEINIDDCSPNPCENGGACADGVNGYTCTCAAGYEGTNCETSAPVTRYMYICDKNFQSEETICAEGTETCDSCDKKGEQCWVASCGGGGQTAATGAGDGEIAGIDDGNASDSVDSDSNGTEQASVGGDAATQKVASISFLWRNRRQKKRRNLRR